MGSGASSDPWMSRMYPDELVENDRIPGWWRFSKIFGIFNPIFLGKFMIQFDNLSHIFQMGLVKNHQLKSDEHDLPLSEQKTGQKNGRPARFSQVNFNGVNFLVPCLHGGIGSIYNPRILLGDSISPTYHLLS